MDHNHQSFFEHSPNEHSPNEHSPKGGRSTHRPTHKDFGDPANLAGPGASAVTGSALNTRSSLNKVVLPQQARVKCPHCFQIFRTFRNEWVGPKPEFKCSSCQGKFLIFSTDFSPLIMGKPIRAFNKDTLADSSPPPHRPEGSLLGKSTKICPRCTEEVPINNQECSYCGVVFIKMLEGVESTFQLRGDWAKVIKNWHDSTIHDNFLQSCHKQKELIYGISCYGRVLKEDKDNQKAKEMIKRMEALTWFFKEDPPAIPPSLTWNKTLNTGQRWLKSHAFDALMLALTVTLFLYIFL